MGVCKADIKFYDAEGRWIITRSIHMPDELDWMPIEVKAHWVCWIGQGPANTKSALISSQGEQRLLSDITLNPLDYETYKERLEKSHDEIERFIEEGGFSRKPANQ